MARRTMLRALLLALGTAGIAHAGGTIPVHRGGPGGVEKVMFEDYVRLTQNLTMPAIIKSFFDPADFADVCACSPTAPLFDGVNLPFTSAGNANFELRKAQEKWEEMAFNAIDGGDFYRKHACAADKDDYIFYDVNNGAMVSASVQEFFRNKIDPKLRTQERITDEKYDYWFNEIFIGGSTKEYPLPGSNGSGSAPHRAPVLNFYFQVCGKKRWTVAHHGASFGELDAYQWMLTDEDMTSFMNDPQVFLGSTEPGDVLLNPPWVWHLVQADRGFNFAVTYKQTGYGWWAAVNKMDPTQVAVNMQYGAYDLREQKLPNRPVHQLPLYLTRGAFILDFWDIRLPPWILKRFHREFSLLALTLALLLACCVGSCCCLRRCCAGAKAKQS